MSYRSVPLRIRQLARVVTPRMRSWDGFVLEQAGRNTKLSTALVVLRVTRFPGGKVKVTREKYLGTAVSLPGSRLTSYLRRRQVAHI